MAPEIFKNKQYTEKVDVYSFGIILVKEKKKINEQFK